MSARGNVRGSTVAKRAGRTAAERKDQLLAELRQMVSGTQVRSLETVRQELEASRNSFAALYEHAPVGYVTLDKHGHVHDANSAAAELLGLGKNRLRGLRFSMLIGPRDVRNFAAHLARSQRSFHEKVITEVQLQTRNKSSVPVQLVSVPLDQGPQRMFLTALVDLTERQQHEQALARAREFAESIVETVREPLAVLDGDLKIVSVNCAFSHFLKQPAPSARGRSLDDLMNLWWTGNKMRSELERVLASGRPLENFEIEVEPRELGKRILLLNARRLPRKEKSSDFILVALEDITVRKQVEEQLFMLNDELEKRVEARTRDLQKSYEQMETFCYSIAHDLRAPLRALTGFSYLLAEQFPQLGPKGTEYTRRIQQSAERMDCLIQDLLSYGRLNTVALPLEEISLEQIFHEVIAGSAKEIAEKKAKIEKKRPLPAVYGHRIVLQLALANLLSNAMKFVAPGVRPRVRVWPEKEKEGGRVRLWVEDNGIGIAPENVQKIFGVFQRLHNTTRYPGTGIGLALVSKGMERIGGRVGVESTPGKGSRFWLELQKPALKGNAVLP